MSLDTERRASPDTLLAEYGRLKAEQNDRIKTRDGLLYFTFAVIGTVMLGAFTSKRMGVILVAPPIVLVLGWTYLSNDLKITQLGRYVREVLAPSLGDGAFGWELDTEPARERQVRKVFQFAADLISFPVAATVLAVSGLLLAPYSILAFIVAVAEIAASASLGRMFQRYAELSKS